MQIQFKKKEVEWDSFPVGMDCIWIWSEGPMQKKGALAVWVGNV